MGEQEPASLVVLFTCKECHCKGAKALVPARRKGEDLKLWMDETMVHVGIRHRRHPPPQAVARLQGQDGQSGDPAGDG